MTLETGAGSQVYVTTVRPPVWRSALAVAVAGASMLSFSAILVRAAGVSPSTAAVFRCVYAIPVLGLLVVVERKRRRSAGQPRRWVAVAAGVALAADLITWNHSIQGIGAGLSSVVGNAQVIVGDVEFIPTWPSAAWLVLLACSSQVVGWLLLAQSLPHLPAAVGAFVLLIQPIGSMVFAALIFGEDPSIVQLVGSAMILLALVAIKPGETGPAAKLPVPNDARQSSDTRPEAYAC